MINSTETYWFPMRVTYGREMIIKQHLDMMGVECFLPMCYKVVEENGKRRHKLVPAINNLVFIHSTFEKITNLKMFDKRFEPLRYMMKVSNIDETRDIMTVSVTSMDNFMKVTKEPSEKVFFLKPGDYVYNNVGKKVKIFDGPFAGVVGIIKRIKRNKHVVVQIENIAAAAIEFVPTNYMMEIL